MHTHAYGALKWGVCVCVRSPDPVVSFLDDTTRPWPTDTHFLGESTMKSGQEQNPTN